MKQNKSTKRSEYVRNHIIHAAEALFMSGGFKNTHTKAIAAAADVSEALLFKYFQTKEMLYEELFLAMLSKHANELSLYLQTDSPAIWLKQFLYDMLIPNDSTCEAALLMRGLAWMQSDHCLIDALSTTKFEEQYLMPIFMLGQEKGEVVEGDPLLLAGLYWRFIVGSITIETYFKPENCISIAKIIDSFIALLIFS